MADYVDWDQLEMIFQLERDQKIYEQQQQEYIHVEIEQMLNMDDDMETF